MSTNSAALEIEDARLQPLPSSHGPLQADHATRWTALLNRIAEGDVDACETFYDESSGLTFSLMMHILQNREAAEEALLDLYLQVWARTRLRAHRTHNPATWLIALARSTALARLRNRYSNGGTQSASIAAPHASVVAFEPFHRDRQHVNRGVRLLTEEQRSIIQLTYFGGLSAREAARQLGLPVQRVTREIQTAMQVLRDTHATNDPQSTAN
jgi:RNA polymerase sigma-70 factor (ECF subfamily)